MKLKVRKTLGSLLDFTRKACEYPKELIESGSWSKIMDLQSLKEMNKLLPDEFLKIRNLFQQLLAETLYILICAKEKAITSQNVELNEETLNAM